MTIPQELYLTWPFCFGEPSSGSRVSDTQRRRDGDPAGVILNLVFLLWRAVPSQQSVTEESCLFFDYGLLNRPKA